MPESYEDLKKDRDRLLDKLTTLRNALTEAIGFKPKKKPAPKPSGDPEVLTSVLIKIPEDWVVEMDRIVKNKGIPSRS